MWREIQIWLVLRLLKNRCEECNTVEEIEKFRKGLRRWVEENNFIDECALSISTKMIYLPRVLRVVNKKVRKFPNHTKDFKEKHLREWDREIPKADSLINSLIDRGWVDRKKQTDGYWTLKTLPPGDDISGIIPMFQHLLSKFWLAWSVIIIPIILAIWTSPWLVLIREKIVSRLY